MGSKKKVIYESDIELLNFQRSAITTFTLNDMYSLRLGGNATALGKTFHPSGVTVTIMIYNDGSARIARELMFKETLLAPGIIGVFSVYKRHPRVVPVVTAVKDSDWRKHFKNPFRLSEVDEEFKNILKELNARDASLYKDD